jgi:hypothetical protein
VIISLTEQGIDLQLQAIDIPHQIAQAASCSPKTLFELKNQLAELRHNLTK